MWNLPSFDEAAQRAALAALQKGAAAQKAARAVKPVLLAVTARIAATGGMKESIYPQSVTTSGRPRHDLFPALEAGKTVVARAYRATVKEFAPRLIGKERPQDQGQLDTLLRDIGARFDALTAPPVRQAPAKGDCSAQKISNALHLLEACASTLSSDDLQRLQAIAAKAASAAAH